MTTRRDFLKASIVTALSPAFVARRLEAAAAETWVNDVHSQLNRTRVLGLVQPSSVADVQEAIREARSRRQPLSIAGARHAAGGQQFASDAPLLDLSRMNRVLGFDQDRGAVDVEAGIKWPDLDAFLLREQKGRATRWCVAQKQGVPLMSLGGTLSANAHGNTVGRGPIISDVESFMLVDAQGRLHRCSRNENPELFRLAIGGYGLFGVMTSVRLRLVRARTVKSVAEVVSMQDIPQLLEQRRAAGLLDAEFQFVTDPGSDDFLRRGILIGRSAADDGATPTASEPGLTAEQWVQLVALAHSSPSAAFDLYSGQFLKSAGTVHWSDDPGGTVYVPDYHASLDRQTNAPAAATEVLMEFFMPPNQVPPFLERARALFLNAGTRVIFGTIRFSEKDGETFLSWAPEARGCVVFNLHTEHTSEGIAATRRAFQALLDISLSLGGTYYLTYNRFAMPEQVERGYPRFREFLQKKLVWDPEERFQSDWYRDYKVALGGGKQRRTEE